MDSNRVRLVFCGVLGYRRGRCVPWLRPRKYGQDGMAQGTLPSYIVVGKFACERWTPFKFQRPANSIQQRQRGAAAV